MTLMRSRILPLLLALGCVCASQTATEEAPPTGDAAEEPAKKAFAVIRITRGHEIAYEAVAIPEKKARMIEVRKDADKEIADWEAARAEHLNDKAKKGEPFLDRKPEPATVTTGKEFATLEEAKAWAEEKQHKVDGDFAIVEIHDMQGLKTLEIIRQKRFNAMRDDLKNNYEKESAAWKKASTAWYSNPGSRSGDPNRPETWRLSPYKVLPPEKPSMIIRKADIETKEKAENLLSDMQRQESK